MKNLVNRNLDEFLNEESNKKESSGDKKFKKVMKHWKEGKQHIGKSKKTVPRTKAGHKQAIAIAYSEKNKVDDK